LTALLHEESLGRDVPVHHTRRLDLDALVGADAAAHLPADDGFAGNHIALHFPALAHQHLAPGAHRADDGPFDLHHPLSGDVADDPHAGPDDRETGFGYRGAVSLLGEDGHVSYPDSRPKGDRATSPRGGFRNAGAARWIGLSCRKARLPAPLRPSRLRARPSAMRVHTWSHTRRCAARARDRKSTRLNSSHVSISYAVFCLK